MRSISSGYFPAETLFFAVPVLVAVVEWALAVSADFGPASGFSA
jgi:hypothetical protein